MPVKAPAINDDQFLSLLQQRRSVRRYKSKPLPRDIINRIIDAAHSSPTGTGRKTTGVIVIDNPEILARFSEIRKLLGLSENREVYASITLGYSKYKFKRVIPRKLAEVRYL